MNRKFIAVAIASALTLGSLGVYAHEGGHGPGHRKMMFGGGKLALEHLTKDLDLTPQQQAQVAPVIEQAKPQLRAIHEEAMQKARAVMENSAAQIRPLLTAEQQQKFDAIKKAHEEMIAAHRNLREAKSQ